MDIVPNKVALKSWSARVLNAYVIPIFSPHCFSQKEFSRCNRQSQHAAHYHSMNQGMARKSFKFLDLEATLKKQRYMELMISHLLFKFYKMN